MIKKMTQFLSDFLWILPFAGFACGYGIAFLYVQSTEIFVPNITGKHVCEGLSFLSSKHLGMRVQQEQESELFAPGTILDQSPKPHDAIRMNQHVYVTVAKKPDPVLTPDVQGLGLHDIAQRCKKLGINVQFYPIPSDFSPEKCIAQHPAAGEPAQDKKMMILVAHKKEAFFVIPDLKGLSIDIVKQNFDQTNVILEVFHQETDSMNTNNNGIIIDQYPEAGTVVDGNKRLILQIEVGAKK